MGAYLGIHNELVSSVHICLFLSVLFHDGGVESTSTPNERNFVLLDDPLLLRSTHLPINRHRILLLDLLDICSLER